MAAGSAASLMHHSYTPRATDIGYFKNRHQSRDEVSLPNLTVSVSRPSPAPSTVNEVMEKQMASLTQRLGARRIINQAKRFQEYNLGGHGVVKNRVEMGSGLSNMNILDMQAKIQDQIQRSKNLSAVKMKLDDHNNIPLDAFDIRSPKQAFAGMKAGRESDIKLKGKSLFGQNGINPIITGDFANRITKNRIKDPFKKHLLTFETKKDMMLKEQLFRKQQRTEKIKYDADQYIQKKVLMDAYQDSFGLIFSE